MAPAGALSDHRPVEEAPEGGSLRPETLLDGLAFPEGPRWHAGRLWFSDMHHQRVVAVAEDGAAETLYEIPNRPSGLGWLPDGRLLVVSMVDRRVLRLEGDAFVTHADLSNLATWHCNDMVVDAHGHAFVGNFGFDLDARADRVPATLARVDPDGRVHAAARDLQFPNGTVITPDGRTLVVGETFGACLTAFDLGADGSLSNRREWARLSAAVPDGICLDADGGIWVASPIGHQVLRVLEGGEVTHRIAIEHEAFACMLGGDDGRTLFVCTAESSNPEETVVRQTGRIEVVRVEAPHAGLP